MDERIEHFDEDSDLGATSEFTEDMRTLFKPQLSVPPEVDRAILDRASRHFAGREFAKIGRRRFRWVALWKVAAAAAVVIFAFSLDLHHKSEQSVHYSAIAGADAVDFDHNGRVDILDAFKLARQIELASDSRADLDINGDGLIDRGDVDMVALAAVSLDKGVI
jgi:hypothetical protein